MFYFQEHWQPLLFLFLLWLSVWQALVFLLWWHNLLPVFFLLLLHSSLLLCCCCFPVFCCCSLDRSSFSSIVVCCCSTIVKFWLHLTCCWGVCCWLSMYPAFCCWIQTFDVNLFVIYSWLGSSLFLFVVLLDCRVLFCCCCFRTPFLFSCCCVFRSIAANNSII